MADNDKAYKSAAPTKLSQIKAEDILASRDLGDGTVSVVTVHGKKLVVSNDAKK